MSAKTAKPFWLRTTLQPVILWRKCFMPFFASFVSYVLLCSADMKIVMAVVLLGCTHFLLFQQFYSTKNGYKKSFQEKKLKRKHGANAN